MGLVSLARRFANVAYKDALSSSSRVYFRLERNAVTWLVKSRAHDAD